MKNDSLTLNYEQLIQRVTALEAQLSAQGTVLDDKDKLLVKKTDKIATLEEYIRYMTQQRFGASSEKTSANQLGLFDEAELLSDDSPSAEDTGTEPTAQPRKKKRPSIPDHLPTTDIIYDLAEDDKFCPHDQQPLRHFADDSSKQLDYIPAKIIVLNHIRRKYLCPCCNYFVTAKKPAQPIEKSIASPGLLSQVAAHKFCDGLPLYRQSNTLFKRLRVELDPTSLANWMIKCGQLVQPLINLAAESLRENTCLFMDETVLQVLKEDGRSATQQSRMWIMTNNTPHQRIVLFHYSPTRETSVAHTMLGDFNGTLMTDGYAVYDSVAKTNGLTHLGCWAHARRYFKEASDAQPKGTFGKPEKALGYIQALFRLEATMKTASTLEKHQRRQQESVPRLAALKKWLDKSLKHPVKSAKLKKALTYLNNQWPKLIRYTDNGSRPMDNNLAENSIRPFVIGRKNWLFAATTEGAKASANLYSLVETAKANNIDPSEYLKTVFTLLPQAKTIEDVEALLPWNINKVVG